jgi:type VI secretion system secreted protein Hcp
MTNKTTRLLSISILSTVIIMFANASQVDAAIFVQIPGMGDDSITTEGYNDGKYFVADSFSFGVDREMKESGEKANDGKYFVADSFSFGVDREMKESGEKAGTADINIGLSEMSVVSIEKSIDTASADLAQFAINGNSPGTAEIHFVEVAGDGSEAKPYLIYKLDRAFIKSWSTSANADDRPTEEVAIYYNKIAFVYAKTNDGVVFEKGGAMSWDITQKNPWNAAVDALWEIIFPPTPPEPDR